jgi:hypothetical protein
MLDDGLIVLGKKAGITGVSTVNSWIISSPSGELQQAEPARLLSARLVDQNA